MKNILIASITLLIAVAGVYYFIFNSKTKETPVKQIEVPAVSSEPSAIPATTTETAAGPTDDTTPSVIRPAVTSETIGASVAGTPIIAYHFGNGEDELLLIGGIHGGYSWNTALLGYELINWFRNEPSLVPDNLTVTIIPSLNPDGLEKITGTTEPFTERDVKGTSAEKVAARFNNNNVDLNRNFDCEWRSTGTWQKKEVSGGSTPFSEPESQAIKDYVTSHRPSAVIAWYSAAGGVYASRCGEGDILPKTNSLMETFSQAAGYKSYANYDYYELTGDMMNWFAKKQIPAVSVLLTTHEATELTKNQTGLKAVIDSLSE